MKDNIFPAFKLTLLCIVLFMGVYTFVIWSIARFAAPNHGKGEIIMKGKQLIGFVNIGQAFTHDKYFWSRPSAVSYNAAGSAGSNKGPSNPEYLEAVQARIDTFLKHNPASKKSEIPTELVTASASGLDPHISLSAALIQAPRIAMVRGVSIKTVEEVIQENLEKPLFGLLGPGKLNVLKLNLALDGLK